MVDLHNPLPIDETDPAVLGWLETLQGNILRHHGRLHAAHVLFAFKQGAGLAARKALLSTLARDYVTSAKDQLAEAARFKERGESGGLFGHLVLSARGYEAIGLNPAALFHELPDAVATSSFAAGMGAHAAEDFGDTPKLWEGPYKQRIDGMLVLAHTDPDQLEAEVQPALTLLRTTCLIPAIESGHVIKNANGKGIEPFGFLDGRSQPLFLDRDFTSISGIPKETTTAWDPFAPLGLVLVRDPGMPADPRCHGSFLVYRKLEQDVRGFRAAVGALSAKPALAGVGEARTGAMVMGRFLDGTALHLSPTPAGHLDPDNDFDYADDIPGKRCPHQAHARKVNPRGSGPDASVENDKRRRIVRRGMTYGTDVPLDGPPAALPSTGAGTLFLCYQASVRRQFAFMQKRWCNTDWSPRAHVGADAVVGQGNRAVHKWHPDYGGDAVTPPLPFPPFITMKGGEFFFAPSLPFFASL